MKKWIVRLTAEDAEESWRIVNSGVAPARKITAPPEARRLVERFELHDTPKHGSWLNMAGIGQ